MKLLLKSAVLTLAATFLANAGCATQLENRVSALEATMRHNNEIVYDLGVSKQQTQKDTGDLEIQLHRVQETLNAICDRDPHLCELPPKPSSDDPALREWR